MHLQTQAPKLERDDENAAFSVKLQRASRFFGAGKLEEAKKIYCEVLKMAPDHAQLLHIIGLIEKELGNSKSAEVYLCKSVEADATRPEFFIHLGQFYNDRGETDNALIFYEKALMLNPDCPEIFCLVGDVYKKAGLYDRAAEWYKKAIRRQPTLSSAHNNLGNCYQALNKANDAIDCFRQVLSLNPNDAKALHNMGNAYLKLCLVEKAIACYEKALIESTDVAGIYNSLGTAYKKKNEFGIAAEMYQKALSLEPDTYLISYNIGANLKDQGKLDEGIKWFKKAVRQNPDFQPAVMQSLLPLPIIYSSQAEIDYFRREYTKGIEVLVNDWETNKWKNPKIHLKGVNGWTNFYLPYQGRNDLNLQQKYGQYLTSVLAANFPNRSVTKPASIIKHREKIRVGYISENMFSHTVGKLFIGWVENADSTEFDIHCYHTQSRADTMTERFRNASYKFRHIFGDIDHIAQQIISDNIHILVFLDVGMTATTQLLAALRLAPVQCVAWGHPVTTGLPTVDYFLSSDFMEPTDGQDYYSEILVKLPNLSICYSKPELPKKPCKKNAFGLKDDDCVFLSSQSLFKYLPEDDVIYPEIALSVPNSRFVFLQHESDNVTHLFRERLGRAFRKYKLEAEKFCIFRPRMSYSEFLSLNMVSDVLLDPPAWSGGMTSLEGISCGLPAVTLPGRFMRSRHTYAMLKLMGIRETIAASKKDYVHIAARLGTDRNFHDSCRESVRKNVYKLYEDRAAVNALESFYKNKYLMLAGCGGRDS